MEAIDSMRTDMTQDEMVRKLLELLQQNGRKDQSCDLSGLCAYVDSLERRIDTLSDQIGQLQTEILAMRQDTVSNSMKQTLTSATGRAGGICHGMKEQILFVKDSIAKKAQDIVSDFGKRGKEALNRVSEFLGVKEKLESMRESMNRGIANADQTISRIEEFGLGMREASQKAANTFRTFREKPVVDYAQQEKKFSKTGLLEKPWQWQKKLFEGIGLRLDAAIDKAENLSQDVKLRQEEHVYGADAFEAAMAESENRLMQEIGKIQEIERIYPEPDRKR